MFPDMFPDVFPDMFPDAFPDMFPDMFPDAFPHVLLNSFSDVPTETLADKFPDCFRRSSRRVDWEWPAPRFPRLASPECLSSEGATRCWRGVMGFAPNPARRVAPLTAKRPGRSFRLDCLFSRFCCWGRERRGQFRVAALPCALRLAHVFRANPAWGLSLGVVFLFRSPRRARSGRGRTRSARERPRVRAFFLCKPRWRSGVTYQTLARRSPNVFFVTRLA